MTFEKFRTYSGWAYTLVFGAIFGYTTFGYRVYDAHNSTSNVGLIFVWIAAGLVGSTFVAIKNRGIVNTPARFRVWACDLAIIAAVLAVSLVLPSWLGLARSALVVVLSGIYVGMYLHALDAGKIMPLVHNSL